MSSTIEPNVCGAPRLSPPGRGRRRPRRRVRTLLHLRASQIRCPLTQPSPRRGEGFGFRQLSLDYDEPRMDSP